MLAVNLYQALYVALATLLMPYRPRTVALVNTSTFRGRRLWKRLYQCVLARFDLTVHGSRGATHFWVKRRRQARTKSTSSTTASTPRTSSPSSLRGRQAAARMLGVKPEALLIGTVGMAGRRRTMKCC